MYTRNSQSAVTSDEDRGDKSTLPREVSSEKKKEKKKSARACRCCFRSLPLFKHRTRYTCLSFLLLPSHPLLVSRESGQPDFSTRKKKKRKWISDIENGSALVTTLIPKSRRMLINFQRITLERVFLLGMYTYMIRESSSKAFPN